jgi:hypothetical protein
MCSLSRALLPAAVLGACLAAPARGGPVEDVRTVDETQRRMVAAGDVAGLSSLAHSNLRINAPGNRVLTREQFLANLRNGEIAAEQFERVPENVTVSSAIAVVMGRETFTPAAASELGRTYGAVPLQRRYTNVYVHERGRWLWLARHANVVLTSSSASLPGVR